MAVRKIEGSKELGNLLRERRKELNLTIEEVASLAGVGTKTWSRYESGESIRVDKYLGICRAMKWKQFPDSVPSSLPSKQIEIDNMRKHSAWLKCIEEQFGIGAALSFALGSDILLDEIAQDLEALSKMCRGTHLGQLPNSWIADLLPKQFLMNYDYDFVFRFKMAIERFIKQSVNDNNITAHKVIEEIALYMIIQNASFLMESEYQIYMDDNWDQWIFDIFGDADILMILEEELYLTKDHIYHWNHWFEDQFYV